MKYAVCLCLLLVPGICVAEERDVSSSVTLLTWFLGINIAIVAAGLLLRRVQRDITAAAPTRSIAEYTVAGDVTGIAGAFDRTFAFGERCGLDIKQVLDLCLVVEEMLSCLVSCGSTNVCPGSFKTRLHYEGGRCEISIAHEGPALQPLENHPPPAASTAPASLEELSLDGVELQILAHYVEDLSYSAVGPRHVLRGVMYPK